jgi:hypothetical protein
MKKLIAIAALLCATSAYAQAPAPTPAPSQPPMVGDKPLVQIKPRVAAAKKPGARKPSSIAEGLQACLEIEDGSKGRLDCYDAVIAPKPKLKGKLAPAKGVADCRFVKEEDERLACFNGFAESIPKFSTR